MGLTLKAQRIAALKRKLQAITSIEEETPWTRQVALLTELLKIGTISRTNCRWARRYITENMRSMYSDQQTITEMDQLEELFIKAEERRARRKEKKLATKAAGRVGRPRKNSLPTPTPAPAAPGTAPVELWQQLLDEQEKS